jgi:serine/threonine protein kinase
MRLQCPNCFCDLEVTASDPSAEVKCPSCGSQVDVDSHLETTVYVAPRLGRFGPFELIERIGRGHFGDVFKARDLRLDRVVAVKVPRINDLREKPLLHVITLTEGRAAQMLHLGGSASAAATLRALFDLLASSGLHPHGHIHELRIADESDVPAGRARSILRVPVDDALPARK